MRVLYVGQPSSERANVFETFLVEHFGAVATASLADLGALDVTGVDVMLVDGDHRAGPPMPPGGLVATDLPVPTVLIGGIGGKVSDSIGLKLGWDHGCLCLDHRAIVDESALGHPIFQGPVPVPVPSPR